MATSVGYRHGDYPVQLGAATVLRAQYGDATHNYPLIPVSELGTKQLVGIVADPTSAAGTLTMLVRGNQISTPFGSNAVSWRDTAASLFSTARGPGVGGPLISTLSITARVGDFATMALNMTGSIIAGSTVAAPAAPTAPIAFRAPDVVIGASGTLIRVQGVNATCTINRIPLFELGTLSLVGYGADSPVVRFDIDAVEATALSLPTPTTASPQALTTITIGSTSLVVSIEDLVLMSAQYAGTVGGWATRRFSYMSMANTGSGGMFFTPA